jgi:glutamate/tyrosine decarboxylase-like PLP-dependent enzyme
VVKVGEEFKKLGFEILNKDNVCVLSFRHQKFTANSIQAFMKNKGWGFSMLQKPYAFQFSFTPMNCTKSEEMIKDMKECV